MSGEPLHTESTAYILALDVGTTTIRAHVYDDKAVIRGTGSRKVILLPFFGQHCVILVMQLQYILAYK